MHNNTTSVCPYPVNLVLMGREASKAPTRSPLRSLLAEGFHSPPEYTRLWCRGLNQSTSAWSAWLRTMLPPGLEFFPITGIGGQLNSPTIVISISHLTFLLSFSPLLSSPHPCFPMAPMAPATFRFIPWDIYGLEAVIGSWLERESFQIREGNIKIDTVLSNHRAQFSHYRLSLASWHPMYP